MSSEEGQQEAEREGDERGGLHGNSKGERRQDRRRQLARPKGRGVKLTTRRRPLAAFSASNAPLMDHSVSPERQGHNQHIHQAKEGGQASERARTVA